MWLVQPAAGGRATTLVLKSDLSVIEIVSGPNLGLAGTLPRRLGSISPADLRLLASVLLASEFDSVAPEPGPPPTDEVVYSLSVSVGSQRSAWRASAKGLRESPTTQAVAAEVDRLRRTLPE
jgi:hypothetical protein